MSRKKLRAVGLVLMAWPVVSALLICLYAAYFIHPLFGLVMSLAVSSALGGAYLYKNSDG